MESVAKGARRGFIWEGWKMIDTETGEMVGVRSITDTLRQVGGGMYLDNASEQLPTGGAGGRQRQARQIDLCITIKKARAAVPC